MAKGKLKRRLAGTQFKPQEEGIKVYTNPELFADEPQPGQSNSSITTHPPDQDNSSSSNNRRVLRPRKHLEKRHAHGNRIMDLNMVIQMINGVASHHSEQCKKTVWRNEIGAF
jgi:hypothetical protein